MKKRSPLVVALSVLALTTIVACAAQFGAAPEPAMDYAEEAAAPREPVASAVEEQPASDEKMSVASGGGGANYAAIERLIIRNASLDIVVSDTQEALDKISQMADDLGGYVVESNSYKYQQGLRASVILRVPAERLGSALDTIRGLAVDVRSESFSGQDVTDEYVDLSSRLRNLEATEMELLELLTQVRERTASAEDILAVHRELTDIRGQIEQTRGRVEYLQESAAMSRVSVELTPDELAQPIEVGGWRPVGTLRNAIERLVRIMQGLVDALIVIALNVVPVLIVLAVPVVAAVLIVRALRTRRRAQKAEAREAAALVSEEAEGTEIQDAE